MRFLFVSAQMPGHLDWGGYLATAVELQRLGHTVLWASGQAVVPLITATGVTVHCLQETGWRWPPPPPLVATAEIEPDTVQRLRAARALDQWLDEARVEQACTELVALGRVYQPDLIVSEQFVGAAGLAAEVLAIPFAVAGWPALSPKVAAGAEQLSTEARQRLARLCARFAVKGVNWTASGAPALLSPLLQLTYWSPRWFANVPLLPQTRHAGGKAAATAGSLPPWALSKPAITKPWVFITLGTSFGDDPNFFIAAAQAADELGCLPILALGKQLSAAQRQTLRARLPADAVIEELIDLDALLPQVAAAIHHGGAGTTHALITHAVPQIIVPHAADQAHQAQGVVRSGVGLYLAAKATTIPSLVAALAQVLPDLSPYRHAAQTLRDEFAALGGIPTAAAHLIALAEAHTPHY